MNNYEEALVFGHNMACVNETTVVWAVYTRSSQAKTPARWCVGHEFPALAKTLLITEREVKFYLECDSDTSTTIQGMSNTQDYLGQHKFSLIF